jgi:hypothetical protein
MRRRKYAGGANVIARHHIQRTCFDISPVIANLSANPEKDDDAHARERGSSNNLILINKQLVRNIRKKMNINNRKHKTEVKASGTEMK